MASGGTITRVNQDIIHTFTASGDFICDFYGTVEVLIVAGGGGGGGVIGGGGGGGGIVYTRRVAVSPQTYPIVVGTGGTGGTGWNTATQRGNPGNNSTAFGLTAIGGGGGSAHGGNDTRGATSGGSGGGGANANVAGGAGTTNQGNTGGNAGTVQANFGAGGSGLQSIGAAYCVPGNGFQCDISGTLTYYAGGGAGGVRSGYGGATGGGLGGGGTSTATSVKANDGGVNTGGGGGGAGYNGDSSSVLGGSGGSGIVIIRYKQDEIISAVGRQARELLLTPFFQDPALIAYYRFEANSVDSKNGLNGTDYNMAYYTGGVFVGDAGFNGSSSRIDLPNSTLFDVQRLTISAWVYSTNFNQNGFIFEKGSVNTQYSLFFEGDYLNFRIMYAGFSDWNDISTMCRNAESGMVAGWNHIVATYDGEYKRIYVNGVLAYSRFCIITIPTGNSGERIGAYGGASPSYWFNGAIDDLAVFGRALSAEEVALLYSAPPPLVKYNRDRTPGLITGL